MTPFKAVDSNMYIAERVFLLIESEMKTAVAVPKDKIHGAIHTRGAV